MSTKLMTFAFASFLPIISLAHAQSQGTVLTPTPAPPPATEAAPIHAPASESSFIAGDSDISGAEEFIRYCSVCHGIDAKGKGALASSLKKAPADLTQISQRNNGHFPFSRIARIVRDGGQIASHGSNDMPAWGEVFRDHADPIMARALIFELTLYIEGIQKK